MHDFDKVIIINYYKNFNMLKHIERMQTTNTNQQNNYLHSKMHLTNVCFFKRLKHLIEIAVKKKKKKRLVDLVNAKFSYTSSLRHHL